MKKVEIISKRTLREKLLTYFSLQAQLQGKKQIELPVGRIGLADIQYFFQITHAKHIFAQYVHDPNSRFIAQSLEHG